MNNHDPWRYELGAYVIGSLPEDEAAAVERHLADCDECRTELAALTPLPALLSRLSADEAHGQTLSPSAALLPRAIEAVRTEHDRDRRRLRRWRLAAGSAAAVAAAALALPALSDLTTPGGTAFIAATGVTAEGTGHLEERPWGTFVELDLAELPPADGYRAYATARDGHSEVTASWAPTPQGKAVVTGATGIPTSQLTTLDVRTTDGRLLLTMSLG